MEENTSILSFHSILGYFEVTHHSNLIRFFASEQNYLQNDTKFFVVCSVLLIVDLKMKIITASVTSPLYLTQIFTKCDPYPSLAQREKVFH